MLNVTTKLVDGLSSEGLLGRSEELVGPSAEVISCLTVAVLTAEYPCGCWNNVCRNRILVFWF